MKTEQLYLNNRLSITGLGMMSSLGHDVATSCAAARAGITKLSEINEVRFADPETDEQGAVSVHAVWGAVEGFAGLGRIVQLGTGALKDLINNSKISDWSRVGIILLLSDEFHLIKANKEDKDVIFHINDRQELLRDQVLSKITNLSGHSIESQFQRTLFGNEASVVDMLRVANQCLQNDEFEQVIIGAIHSELDIDALESLNTLGILKTPSQSAGLIPGEMAAFFIVENECVAIKKGRHCGVTIEAMEDENASYDRFSESLPLGMALSTSISRTLNSISDTNQKTGLLIGNLNGDSLRAQDWGTAIIRLKAVFPEIELPEWYPALSFGDIGVASGFAAICMAVKGFERNYAGTNGILVWLTSDREACGSFFVGFHPS